MGQTAYKLYASAAAAGSVSMDIQRDGHITGLLLDLSIEGANALDDEGAMEVSFSASAAFTTSDTRASIGGLHAVQGFLTTGGSQTGKVVSVAGLMIPVAAGERVYMHYGAITGTLTLVARAWLYVDDGSDGRERPRSRIR